MNWNWGSWCEKGAEALLNGGYQGLALIAVTALVLKALPRTNATTRHAVLFVAMLLAAALPLLHLVAPAFDQTPSL
jgi:hypothetical protein